MHVCCMLRNCMLYVCWLGRQQNYTPEIPQTTGINKRKLDLIDIWRIQHLETQKIYLEKKKTRHTMPA